VRWTCYMSNLLVTSSVAVWVTGADADGIVMPDVAAGWHVWSQ
jgi:hypothetical protein